MKTFKDEGGNTNCFQDWFNLLTLQANKFIHNIKHILKSPCGRKNNMILESNMLFFVFPYSIIANVMCIKTTSK